MSQYLVYYGQSLEALKADIARDRKISANDKPYPGRVSQVIDIAKLPRGTVVELDGGLERDGSLRPSGHVGILLFDVTGDVVAQVMSAIVAEIPILM